MEKDYYDYYDEIEEDDLFDENKSENFEDEDNYPTAEEYNRIFKQRHDYY